MLTRTDPDRIRLECLEEENRQLRKLLQNAEDFGRWGGRRNKKRGDELGPRQEEVLSYLIGLGPVGSMVRFSRDVLMADLRINTFQGYYSSINSLLGLGYIRRISSGYRSDSTFIVLKRGGL